MKSQKNVNKAAALVMAAIFLSRALGMVRDSFISGFFGQGRNTDIYYSAFRLPDILFYLIAGGALSSAFVPVFVEYISTDRREAAYKTFNTLATVMTVVIGSIIVLGEIFARQLVPVVAAPGFSPHELHQVAHLTRIVLPAQIFFFIGGLMMGVQWAHQKFAIPGLGPSVYNIGIITGGVVLGSALGPKGIEGLAWGALGGAFVGNFLLQALAVRKLDMKFRPSLDFHDEGAAKVWKLMIPVIFSLSLPQIDVYVNGWFATFLFPGAVTAIDRANRLMQLPVGIFGQAIAIAFFPTLSALVATGSKVDFRAAVNYGLRVMSFVAIPASVLIVVLRYPIIEILFQHGKFKGQMTSDVAHALLFYGMGIFAWCMQALIARAFYAMQDTRTPVWTGTAVTALFIPMNIGLIHAFGGYKSHYAHMGLALSTTIAASLHMFLLLEILRRRAGGLNAPLLIKSISKVIAASSAMGIAAWAGMHFTGSVPHFAHLGVKYKAISEMLVALTAGGMAFLLFVKILKVEEAEAAFGMIRKRISRSAA